MPSLLPIIKGEEQIGAILVLLDGVMIATRSAECTRAWSEQLGFNERRFRVLVKERGTKDLSVAGEETEFAGVVFSSARLRPKVGKKNGERTLIRQDEVSATKQNSRPGAPPSGNLWARLRPLRSRWSLRAENGAPAASRED